MLEPAGIMAAVSAVLLIVAVAAWVKLFGGPELQRLDGSAASTVGNVNVASRLLILAVGVSAVAATMAVLG